MGRDRAKGHLDTLILSVLHQGQAHGYEVIAELRRRSDGEFDLPEGTVYPALHRLEADGL
ncbi:MAG: PadR family transcriptional regulator, partial [Nocardioidaceae bacterium]